MNPTAPSKFGAWCWVFLWCLQLGVGCFVLGSTESALAGSLSGSARDIPQHSVVNLSTNGTLDWVHWGLYTETTINRKSGVVPQISDYAPLDNTNGFVSVYQYADNFNGYTWTDGDPIPGVTNTTTGVWAYGLPTIGTGFQITAPAGPTPRTLRVYCGVFAGAGRFEARLSDGSAAAYTYSFSNIPGNGPSQEITLRYSADTSGQTLIIRWTLAQPAGGAAANVTLQAAALSAEGVNNPPIVHLISPAADANIAASDSVSLTATASDLDGSIAKVEFFANGTQVGEDTTAPFTATWNSPGVGRYTLTAVATDNSGETTTSPTVVVTVYGVGGSLTGGVGLPPQSVNLTVEGMADWQHWGLSPSNLVNRKSGVSPLLSPLDPIGVGEFKVYSDNYSAFSWSDGTPTEAAGPVRHGVFVYGLGNGFEFTVPADATSRKLRVYAGLYGAQGHFEAWLSDFSAPMYHSHSLSNFFGNDYGVFTLDYAAAGPGPSLVVRYFAERLFDSDFGNVTIQAATLQGGDGIPLLPVQIVNPTLNGGHLAFSFQTQAGRSYAALWREQLGDTNWQTFATVPGTGGMVSVTNQDALALQRFYRVETK